MQNDRENNKNTFNNQMIQYYQNPNMKMRSAFNSRKIDLKSFKIGFCTKLDCVKKNLNLLGGSKDKLDIYLYFELKKPVLKMNIPDANSNNSGGFQGKNAFTIEFESEKNKLLSLSFQKKNIQLIGKNKKYPHIVEIHLKKGFETLHYDLYLKLKCSRTPPFFKLNEDQILRNWVQKPVIRLEFENSNKNNDNNSNQSSFNPAAKSLLDYIYRNQKNEKKKTKRNTSFITTEFIHYDKYMCEINSQMMKLLKQYQQNILDKMKDMSIGIRFAIFSILSSDCLMYPIDLDEMFIDQLIIYKDFQEKFVEFFKYFDFDKKATKENKFFFTYLIQRLANWQMRKTSKKVKKIILTPTNLIFKYDYLNFSNRILDDNKQNEDYFLIITFADINLYRDYYSFITKHRLVDCFEKIIDKGIKIGIDMKFEFLCYSNSQLRNHSLWMICENKNFTMDKIFAKQGRFDNIHDIAASGSRRGLCLTSAVNFGKILKENIQYDYPDYEKTIDENLIDPTVPKNFLIKTYNFTDGIGMCSPELAYKITNRLFKGKYASSFQIRLGGHKGVIAINPKLKGEKIVLRKSMKKFESESTDLYIIRKAGFSPGYLNKQIITLLSALGVQDKVFEEILENEIFNIKNSLNSYFFKNQGLDLKISDIAYDIISSFDKVYSSSNSCDDNNRNSKGNTEDSKKNMLHTIKRTNPFFKGIYFSVLINKLLKFKEKLKLFDEYSGKFIGVIDELGVLNENEVFIQVSKTDSMSNADVIQGPVVITKNPNGYLEDIQVLFAVDNDQLRKFSLNQVVFPRTSKKPIQYLTSGGDLDGDIYYVSWNTKLVPEDLLYNTRKIPSYDYLEKKLKLENKICDEENLTKNLNIGKDKDNEQILGKVNNTSDSNNNFVTSTNFSKDSPIFELHGNNLSNSNNSNKNNLLLKDNANKHSNHVIINNFNYMKTLVHDFITEKNSTNKNKTYEDINSFIISEEDLYPDINSSILPKENDNLNFNKNIKGKHNPAGKSQQDFNFFNPDNLIDISQIENSNNSKASSQLGYINNFQNTNKNINLDQKFFDINSTIIDDLQILKNLKFADEKNNINDFSLTYDSLFTEDNELGLRMNEIQNSGYRKKLTKFFFLYLKNDILGIICNIITALADKNGVDHEDTIISYIYQRKSDTFFKTGKTILIKNLNKIKEYPDFMERDPEISYPSQKALGKLYRRIMKEFDDVIKTFKDNDEAASIPKQFLEENLILFRGFEIFLEISWDFYDRYYYDLHEYLGKYSLEQEFEFISNIRSPLAKKFKTKFHDDYETKVNMQKDLNKLLFCYKKYYLTEILHILSFFVSEEIVKHYIFYEDYERIMMFLFNNDSYSQDFYNKYKKLNFSKIDKRFENLLDKAIKKPQQLINKGITIHTQSWISEAELEKIINDNILEILDIKEDEGKIYLPNIKKFYGCIKKAFISSIYFCCYFGFYKEYGLVKQYVISNNKFERGKKVLKSNFNKIEKEYEDINREDFEGSIEPENYIRNINYFSLPWILDYKLLLEIKLNNINI